MMIRNGRTFSTQQGDAFSKIGLRLPYFIVMGWCEKWLLIAVIASVALQTILIQRTSCQAGR